jgi:hypothetical protein
MNESGRARRLLEASVRLPPRGRRWIAAYTGVEPGQQVWRSTGETNREAALAKALAWEAEAWRRRAALGVTARPPGIRVSRGEAGSLIRVTSPVGPLSQKEVAMILQISERAVRNIEHRALAKLRRHPDLRELWSELAGRTGAEQPGVLENRETKLTPAEVAALFGLAKTTEEAQALTKLLAWIEGDTG